MSRSPTLSRLVNFSIFHLSNVEEIFAKKLQLVNCIYFCLLQALQIKSNVVSNKNNNSGNHNAFGFIVVNANICVCISGDNL